MKFIWINISIFWLATDPLFDQVKSNLVQSIVSRLEDEVVKELVNALYHFAMTRLNPDDVTVCNHLI